MSCKRFTVSLLAAIRYTLNVCVPVSLVAVEGGPYLDQSAANLLDQSGATLDNQST